ncbi:MAG: response regulator [Synechococcales cyanobacterium CRU_2_2]|nr:response regulator [Synechococcales cyanobacterium CRU_2_2]
MNSASAEKETLYPVPLGTSPLQLAGIIQQIIQAEINGRLCLSAEQGRQWNLYFQVGRIVWASGGDHRFRRWHRVLRQLNISPASIQIRERILPAQWEHLVLTVMLKRQRIQKHDAIAAIETNIIEVLFDILQAAPYINQIACNIVHKTIGDSPVTILGTPDEFISKARLLLKEWQATGLANYSPNLAPVPISQEAIRKKLSPQLYVDLATTLTGKLSIRDLAASKRQSLIELSRFLEPYASDRLLAFQPIADIPAPTPVQGLGDRSKPSHPTSAPLSASPREARSDPSPGPLVICVDDSPQVGYILEQVLMPLGYQVLTMQDPVEALSTIMRRKPDLIFLDLIMPVVNGYELCSQIRRVSALKRTPVVILTGNDGVIDRVRAKMVGATDFMGKPVIPDKVLEVLQQHLAYEPMVMNPTTSSSLAAV